MVLLRNFLNLFFIVFFLSTTTAYASSYSKKTSIVKKVDGNILLDILEIAYNLGVDLGIAIKIYFNEE